MSPPRGSEGSEPRTSRAGTQGPRPRPVSGPRPPLRVQVGGGPPTDPSTGSPPRTCQRGPRPDPPPTAGPASGASLGPGRCLPRELRRRKTEVTRRRVLCAPHPAPHAPSGRGIRPLTGHETRERRHLLRLSGNGTRGARQRAAAGARLRGFPRERRRTPAPLGSAPQGDPVPCGRQDAGRAHAPRQGRFQRV